MGEELRVHAHIHLSANISVGIDLNKVVRTWTPENISAYVKRKVAREYLKTLVDNDCVQFSLVGLEYDTLNNREKEEFPSQRPLAVDLSEVDIKPE